LRAARTTPGARQHLRTAVVTRLRLRAAARRPERAGTRRARVVSALRARRGAPAQVAHKGRAAPEVRRARQAALRGPKAPADRRERAETRARRGAADRAERHSCRRRLTSSSGAARIAGRPAPSLCTSSTTNPRRWPKSTARLSAASRHFSRSTSRDMHSSQPTRRTVASGFSLST
jgi:hypothetical protein